MASALIRSAQQLALQLVHNLSGSVTPQWLIGQLHGLMLYIVTSSLSAVVRPQHDVAVAPLRSLASIGTSVGEC
jgi:hypothetical protein